MTKGIEEVAGVAELVIDGDGVVVGLVGFWPTSVVEDVEGGLTEGELVGVGPDPPRVCPPVLAGLDIVADVACSRKIEPCEENITDNDSKGS